MYNNLVAEATEQVNNEIQQRFDEFHKNPNPYETEKVSNYDDPNFKSVPPTPKHEHSVYAKDQVSFWSENLEKIDSVSQMRVPGSPFRKNTAFTKTYTEYLNERLPHE